MRLCHHRELDWQFPERTKWTDLLTGPVAELAERLSQDVRDCETRIRKHPEYPTENAAKADAYRHALRELATVIEYPEATPCRV